MRYNLVLNTGRASYAADQGASAGAERQIALNAKANVAVREMFNNANDLYNKAAGSMEAEKFEDAAAMFYDSEVLFSDAAKAAEEKRRIAEAAILAAEAKMEASDEAARQAEIIIEGDLQ